MEILVFNLGFLTNREKYNLKLLPLLENYRDLSLDRDLVKREDVLSLRYASRQLSQ